MIVGVQLISAPGNEAFLWKAIKPRLDEKLLAPEEGGDEGGGSPNDTSNDDVEMAVVKNEMTDVVDD